MLRRVLLVLAAALAGAAVVYLALRPRDPGLPDPPALVTRMREVARLETLDVSLYKKVTFRPDPPQTDALWKDVLNFARFAMNAPRGKAIVFADAHLGYDLGRMRPEDVRVEGRRVTVFLPPLEVRVALKPGETEVIDSNLDSQQTAELLELARAAFEREVREDPALQARARESAERALGLLLQSVGFSEVRFEPSGTRLAPPR